jgi:hypothetical protein
MADEAAPISIDPGRLDAIRRLRPFQLGAPSLQVPSLSPVGVGPLLPSGLSPLGSRALPVDSEVAPPAGRLRPSLAGSPAPITADMPDMQDQTSGDTPRLTPRSSLSAPSTRAAPPEPSAESLGPRSLGAGTPPLPPPIRVTMSDVNAPEYQPLRGWSALGPTLAQFAGIPTKNGLEPLEGVRQLGQRALEMPQERYQRDLKAAESGLQMQDVASQIAERERQANLPTPLEHFPAGEMVADPNAPGGFRQVGTPKPEKTETVESGGQAYEKQTDGSWKAIGSPKPQRLTDPFEAFAYGTPEEKQAAKDFLDAEKKAGARYDKPGEIEQRYDLFRKDPDSYRQMFGDRGGAQDKAQASRMLQFFDKQRKEIEQDWTLDEPTKAQRLAEIQDLERPYLDTAAAAPAGDRVTVVSPQGKTGTIPRSQLKDAQKKGYKTAR